jgi:hypothetical protein
MWKEIKMMAMEELLLNLENKLKSTLLQQQFLKRTNQNVRCENQILLAERQKIAAQIETLIAKLKALES